MKNTPAPAPKPPLLKRMLQARNQPVTPESLAAVRDEMSKVSALAAKTGFAFTETHNNITVNQQLSSAGFAR